MSTVNTKSILEFLKDTKYIWNTKGLNPHYSYGFIHNKIARVYNGYFFASTPIDCDDLIFSVPELHTILTTHKEESFSMEVHEDTTRVQAGRKKAVFAWPVELSALVNKFYYQGPSKPVIVNVSTIKECCSHIYKENMELSNVYLHNGKIFSTDAFVFCVGECPNISISIPLGMEKLLHPNEEGCFLVSHETSMITLVGKYTISAMVHAGDGKKVYGYLPSVFPDKTCTFNDKCQQIVSNMKKYDTEFKKLDSKMIVRFSNNKASFTFEGNKSKFMDICDVECEDDFEFSVNPSKLETFLKGYNTLYFKKGLPYIAVKEDLEKYLWIE